MRARAQSLETHRQRFRDALRVRGYAEASIRSYGASVALFGRYLSGCDPAMPRAAISDLREVDRRIVGAYATWLSLRQWSVHTRHMHIKALRRFFEHLVRRDVVLFNPCAGLGLPKLGDRLPRAVLTVQEARRILDGPDVSTAKGVRDRAILEMFYSTGIQGGEMAALSIQDVDWRGGFVRVERGKFARGRMVPMGRVAAAWARKYLLEVRPAWSTAQANGTALWLCSLRPHRPMTIQAIAVMVHDAKRDAGVHRPGRTHLWRHTCATHLVAGGADIAHVQRLLGHRSMDTTQRYVRVAVREVRAAVLRSHPRSAVPASGAEIRPERIGGPRGR